MNIKFLDKVVDQIVSETRIIDTKLYTPFFPPPLSLLHLPFSFSLHPSSFYLPSLFYNHCKCIYSLNEQETEYVWDKYKEGIVSIINNKKELC